MKNKYLVLAAVAISLLLSGCGSNLMRNAPSQAIPVPKPEQVNIVFMRSSFVASAIGCDVFEVVNGELKFIGQLPTGNKIVYSTTPGKKIFMTYGSAADFMLADVVGGKTYYSIVRPNWGSGGFAPTPIRSDSTAEFNVKSKEFRAWLSETKAIEPKEDAQSWFVGHKDRLQETYKEYWSKFETKNRQEKLERTLMPEDGQ